jgi:glycerate kinase
MEAISVSAISRIAEAAARRTSPQLQVTGVTINAGGSDYVEILFDIRGCHRETCQVVLGVFRNVTESALESAIADQLRAHVDEHHADGRSSG